MELSEKEINELLELTRDNNRMLHRMRRNMIWSKIFTFLYWMVILGVMGASYYFLQPYVTKYWDVYQSTMKTLEGVQQTGSTFQRDISVLLEKAQ
ncbi:MAG TPA: hypothetical protein VJZ94_03965, partial [Candidatus Paceibacterota bacterium]|uniref:Uncharacterized protein n=1 Tax=Candidatus Lloydbacteria bacterium RIFCSPHIGHO2_02_FULL_50_13 TaxID=1798661 RepID=A0A1G2DA58_9BACT|nr:MAG: hypothetical protein A3D65_04190 [Candidatus Lloydbacteria bacterium RIFCSPHIGHO2_02_FULL_50_13]HXK31844.1 hypothetical protein [Candidatus Paceibacterota bacterium]